MFGFALRRLVWSLPTLLLLLVLTFALTKMAPGDPVLFQLSQSEQGELLDYSEIQYQQMAKTLDLDKPAFYISIWPSTVPARYATTRKSHRSDLLQVASYSRTREEANSIWQAVKDLPARERNLAIESHSKSRSLRWYIPAVHWWGLENQFHDWFTRALRLEFGNSRATGQSAISRVLTALRWTLVVNLLAILLGYLVAIPLGLYRAYYPESKFDRLSGFLVDLLYAMPVFWLGTILVVFFTTSEYGRLTNIFPSAGIWQYGATSSFTQMILANGGQLLIPVLTIGSSMMAYISQQVRSSTVEELAKEYVWHLHAKGMSPSVILWKHVFRNASMPLVTMLAKLLPIAVGGSLVMEVICNIPGMGRMMYDSIFAQDWNVVMIIVLIGSVLTILGILLSDVMYGFVDPRIKMRSR